jgi:hypothetical protein
MSANKMVMPSSGIHRFGGGWGGVGGGCKLLVAFKRPKKEGETGGFIHQHKSVKVAVYRYGSP